MDKKEWIPCSERMPAEKGSSAIVECWVSICGFSTEGFKDEPEYVSTVAHAMFYGGRWDIEPCRGLRIVAWMLYYQPAPYVEPRKTCKLCCGEKVLPSGEVCWRCDGRGDEAADGSDAVQKFRGSVKPES